MASKARVLKRIQILNGSLQPDLAKASTELRTRDMLHYIRLRPYTPFSRKARMFLLSLALCHTCLPEVQENGETHFMAASPDELALVQAAQDLGFLVINRDVHTITLKITALWIGGRLDRMRLTRSWTLSNSLASVRECPFVLRFPRRSNLHPLQRGRHNRYAASQISRAR